MKELYEKLTKAKRAGVMAQVVESLGKWEALSSKPKTAKNK
jgi:hypothetical protein